MNQEIIEKACVDYITINGKLPKFVVMSNSYYEEFNKQFYPIERTPSPGILSKPNISTMHLTDCVVSIISANNVDDNFFEVLG